MSFLPPVALLLVDDNTQTRDYAVRVLQEAGYVVLTADAATALQILEGGGIEALIVPDGMIGATSNNLARQVRGLRRDLKIVFLPWLKEAAPTVAPAKAADWLLRDVRAATAPPADATARPMTAT